MSRVAGDLEMVVVTADWLGKGNSAGMPCDRDPHSGLVLTNPS